jgi:DNA-binding NarL/FixJ family response regulator
MRGNVVIIATKAVFFADILREQLTDAGLHSIIAAAGDKDLKTKLQKTGARCILLEQCFHGQGTEGYILRLMKRYRNIRIAVWSTVDLSPAMAARLLMAGAESYFTLRDTDEAIRGIIRRIAAGRSYYPEDVGRLFESATYFPILHNGLTTRELEVLKLTVTGQPNKKIAEVLGIKLPTPAHDIRSSLGWRTPCVPRCPGTGPGGAESKAGAWGKAFHLLGDMRYFINENTGPCKFLY